MSYYADTSVIVSVLTNEVRSAEMEAWLAAQAPGDVATSDWVTTEVSAALARKVRMGELSAEVQPAALAAFARLSHARFIKRPFEARFFAEAAALADRHETGLRAGDALHLAVAIHFSDVLVTLDGGMASAGRQLGGQTLLL